MVDHVYLTCPIITGSYYLGVPPTTYTLYCFDFVLSRKSKGEKTQSTSIKVMMTSNLRVKYHFSCMVILVGNLVYFPSRVCYTHADSCTHNDDIQSPCIVHHAPVIPYTQHQLLSHTVLRIKGCSLAAGIPNRSDRGPQLLLKGLACCLHRHG